LESPEIVHIIAETGDGIQVAPPGLDRTVYEVIAEPPSQTGANHMMVARVGPGMEDTDLGELGVVNGVAEVVPGFELATAFWAMTLKE